MFDITGDELPELWVKTGTCEADYMLYVYTYENEAKKLFETGSGQSTYYKGPDYIIQMFAQMGYELWTKFSYKNGKFVSEKVYEGSISGDEEYKYPKEPRVEMKQFVPVMSEEEKKVEARLKEFYTKCIFLEFGEEPKVKVEDYCTKKLLKKLEADNDYEDGGYAMWDFRTSYQDGDGPSKLTGVEPLGDNKYKVSFLDMGWKGSHVITIKWIDGVPLFDEIR